MRPIMFRKLAITAAVLTICATSAKAGYRVPSLQQLERLYRLILEVTPNQAKDTIKQDRDCWLEERNACRGQYTEDCRTEFDPHWYRKLQDRYCSLYPDDTKLDASYFVSSDRGIVI
jgi:hypothetical protein